jgi:hypothetical protein
LRCTRSCVAAAIRPGRIETIDDVTSSWMALGPNVAVGRRSRGEVSSSRQLRIGSARRRHARHASDHRSFSLACIGLSRSLSPRLLISHGPATGSCDARFTLGSGPTSPATQVRRNTPRTRQQSASPCNPGRSSKHKEDRIAQTLRRGLGDKTGPRTHSERFRSMRIWRRGCRTSAAVALMAVKPRPIFSRSRRRRSGFRRFGRRP